jgi:hypothetical protein
VFHFIVDVAVPHNLHEDEKDGDERREDGNFGETGYPFLALQEVSHAVGHHLWDAILATGEFAHEVVGVS